MSFSLIVLIIVFLGIALRNVFRIPLKIWQIMGIGAAIVLFTGRISVIDAYLAVDWNIIFFLWGMFYIGQALEESGILCNLASGYFQKKCSYKMLVFIIVFGMGLFSAILMNDTLAIIGTPLLIKVASQKRVSLLPLLLGLAFAITTGSVLSPIGNPQNLLIALDLSIANPFVTFLKYLAVPTLINLALLFFYLLWIAKKDSSENAPQTTFLPIHRRLKIFSKIAIAMVLVMITYNIIASLVGIKPLPLIVIALIPSFFLMIFAPKRKKILRKLDWHTLVFFAAMFILMQSVFETSSIKSVLDSPNPFAHSIGGILSFSALVSQLISNVPLVALYLPILKGFAATQNSYMALAAGSTIAGNFLIFGAASNLIILQNAEKQGGVGISFFEFAKYGIPLTIANLAVYYLYLTYVV